MFDRIILLNRNPNRSHPINGWLRHSGTFCHQFIIKYNSIQYSFVSFKLVCFQLHYRFISLSFHFLSLHVAASAAAAVFYFLFIFCTVVVTLRIRRVLLCIYIEITLDFLHLFEFVVSQNCFHNWRIKIRTNINVNVVYMGNVCVYRYMCLCLCVHVYICLSGPVSLYTCMQCIWALNCSAFFPILCTRRASYHDSAFFQRNIGLNHTHNLSNN